MSMADNENKAKSSSFFQQLRKTFSRTDASFSSSSSSSSPNKSRGEEATQPPKQQHHLHSLDSNTTPESNESLLPHNNTLDTTDIASRNPKPVKDRDIKFADTTPKQASGSSSSGSSHTRKNDISPSDIARSILIMDNRRKETEKDASDSTILDSNQSGNVLEKHEESDTCLSSDSEIYLHEVSPYHIQSKDKKGGTIILNPLEEEEKEKTDDDKNSKKEPYFVNIKPIQKAATFDDYLIKTSKKKNSSDDNENDEKIDPIARVKSLDVSKNIQHSDSFDLMISNKRRRRSMPHNRLGYNNNNNNTHEDSDFDGGVLRRAMSSKYLSYQPAIQGNSVFLDLDDKQKDELDSVEFRALKVLGCLLICYYILWHLCAILCLLIWIKVSPKYAKIVEAFGIDDVWWSFFTAASAMNNVGLTLTPNSMGSFIENIFILLVIPFFMIIGNTAFPVFLRFIIWILFKMTNEYGQLNESLGFLLDHPRRCFTLLFPSGPTWKLLGILVFLNGLDTLLFLVLDLHNEVVTNLPVGYRILAGYFQAVSTRTTGFAIMDISALHPAVIVSYTIMMYINIFPVAMSVRHTNVYEEQTLGALNSSKKPSTKPVTPHVRTHVMRQVSYDLWFMFIIFFLLCISEGGQITRKENSIPLFNILFEVTSAYGTVGLSLGFPGTMMSLSAQFSPFGKFLIACLLYRGRQRILPYSTDRAIMMPRRIVEEDIVQEDLLKQRENNIRRFGSI